MTRIMVELIILYEIKAIMPFFIIHNIMFIYAIIQNYQI